MTPNKPFSEKDIATATAGADVFYLEEARKVVADFHGDMELDALINNYCTDTDLASNQVQAYIASLPRNSDRVLNAFIRFEMLRSTRDKLAAMLGLEKEIKEEAERGRKDPTVDNNAIRHSAGYNERQDVDVEKSSKTDRAQELNISDSDIGESASEEVTYIDRTAHVSPTMTFIFAVRDLARGICDHCLENNDVFLLKQAGVTSEDPGLMAQHISKMMEKLQPPEEGDL